MVTPSQIQENEQSAARESVPSERRKLGEIMVEQGWISDADVQEALVESKKTGQYIGAVLVRQGKINKEQLGKALSQQFNIQYVNLSELEVDKSLLGLLPQEFMQNNKVIPIAKEGGKLVVAMVEPDSKRIHDEITFMTGMRPQAVVTTSLEFNETFSKMMQAKQYSGLMDEIQAEWGDEFSREEEIKAQQEAEMFDMSNPLVRLVNSVLEEGIEKGASDIHIEARKSGSVIRFRIDGILQPILEVPPNMEASFITRMKVMSRMDIAEHRRPQDGRMMINYKGTEYNLRVNTLPVGEKREKIVIRILRPASGITDFSDLGFGKSEVAKLERLYQAPYGILLVCGPTGSGKSTTLYTILHKINDDIRNISTVEDPIELKVEGLNQSQVNPKAEFTFAGALRALLRQDPDVIMVGEIRDYETLESAIHASLTGHLVFSTIHANTTAATVNRLVEMGAEASMICSALLGVVAQRLVRRLCKGCKVEYEASEEEKKTIFPKRADLQKKPLKLYKPTGCNLCNNAGYSGRVGLYEIMEVNRKIRHLIAEGKVDLEIEDAAVEAGMKTLHMSGLENLIKGNTSFEELVRVLGPTLGKN